nr:MAG TPA: Orsellinic acid biosynthesis cluster protein D [Caudoviricetes sp.]
MKYHGYQCDDCRYHCGSWLRQPRVFFLLLSA